MSSEMLEMLAEDVAEKVEAEMRKHDPKNFRAYFGSLCSIADREVAAICDSSSIPGIAEAVWGEVCDHYCGAAMKGGKYQVLYFGLAEHCRVRAGIRLENGA